jgi:hypothetical protein
LPRDNVADETDSAPDLEAALQAAISPKPAVSPAARPDLAPSPAVSALDALAQGLTAARVTAKRPVEPEPEQKAAPAGSLAEAPKMPGPVAELPATPQKVASEPASPTQEGAVPSPSVIAGLRTLEDTVADLLRPMLRDWLDANMPRIVEKALRVETAKDIKPTSAPKDQK